MIFSDSAHLSKPYHNVRPGRRRSCSASVATAESMELRRLLSATALSSLSGSTGVAESDVGPDGTPTGNSDVSLLTVTLSPVYGPIEQMPQQPLVHHLDAGAWPASLNEALSGAESVSSQFGVDYGPAIPDPTPLYGPFVTETLSAAPTPFSNNSIGSDDGLNDQQFTTAADPVPGLTWRRSDARVSGFRAVADKSPLEIIRGLAVSNAATRKINPDQAATTAFESRPSENWSLAWNAAEAAQSTSESSEDREQPQSDADTPVAHEYSRQESVPTTFAELLSLDGRGLEHARKAGAGSLLSEDLQKSRTGKSSWQASETSAASESSSITDAAESGFRSPEKAGSRRTTTEQRSRSDVQKPITRSPLASASVRTSISARRKSKPAEASDFSVNMREGQTLNSDSQAESLSNRSPGELSLPGDDETESSRSIHSQEAGHGNNSKSDIRRVSHDVPQSHDNVSTIVIRPGNFSNAGFAASTQSINKGHSVISAAASENSLAGDLRSETDDGKVSEDEWWTDAPLIMPQPSRGR